MFLLLVNLKRINSFLVEIICSQKLFCCAANLMAITIVLGACQPVTNVEPKARFSHAKNSADLGLNVAEIVNGEPVATADPIAQATVNIYLDLSRQEPRRGLQNVCTGTLIAPQVVLTAAHCFADLSQRMQIDIDELRDITHIGFGTSVIKSFDAAVSAGIELRKVVKLAVHPKHRVNSFGEARTSPMHDVAVLKLEAIAPDSAKVAKLATEAGTLIKDMSLDFAGFGVINGRDFMHATQLMKTRVKIDKPNFSNTQFSYTITGGRTACSGDSGGPAYLTDLDASGSLVVFGVTSWGDRTCTQFGVYTSVLAMLPWLQEVLINF
jgi:hypothetical protein